MKSLLIMTTKAQRGFCLPAIFFCLLTLLAAHTYAQPLNADVAAGPKMTEARAIQIAQEFCHKIGQQVTVPGKAIFPVTTYEQDESWLPMWSVTFPHQASVLLVDRVGTIIHYDNDAYFSRPNDYAAPGQALPQADALRIARTALAATGEKEELGNETAELRNSTVPPSYLGNEWDVKWDWVYHSVPYLNEGVGLSMDAQTGEIVVIVSNFPCPPLAGTEAAGALARAVAGQGVTPGQAVGVGAEYLAAFCQRGELGYYAALRDPTPLLRLVRPKDGWSHFQDAPGQSRTARPAWVVRMQFRVGNDNEQDVWVDTETGEVLGEDHFLGSLGGPAPTAPAPPPPSLAAMLRTARSVCVLRRGPATKAGWKAAGPLTPGGKDQAAALAALHGTADFRTGAPAGDAPQQVVLVGADNALGAYSYYPDTGTLGQGKEWAVVPGAFRDWARERTAAAPVGPKK